MAHVGDDVLAVGLGTREGDPGVAPGEVVDHGRQQGGRGGREHPDREVRGQAVAGLLDGRPRRLLGGQEDLGVLDQDAADLADPHAAPDPLEDRGTDLGGQGLELLRHGRGREVQGGRGGVDPARRATSRNVRRRRSDSSMQDI